MREEVYAYDNPNKYRYEFTSVSPNKRVQKVVLFTETENKNLFNLALLDVLDSGELCDLAETKNQDMRKVLATTYHIVEHFLALQKHFRVIFSGSDAKRQRLYRIAISGNIAELSKKYVILGATKMLVEHYQPNNKYDLFIIGNKL